MCQVLYIEQFIQSSQRTPQGASTSHRRKNGGSDIKKRAQLPITTNWPR